MCQKNKLLITVIASILFTYPNAVQADGGEYQSRSDKVLLSTGDAQKANIAIHAANPWPRYVNRTRIPGEGRRAAAAMDRYYNPYRVTTPPQTIVNVTTTGDNGDN